MIQNDDEFRVTQSRIATLQETLLSLRKTEKPSNYILMSKGYLMEIDKMPAEVMEYLSRIPPQINAPTYKERSKVTSPSDDA